MPRTERGPELQRKECRWLPHLAPRLPLPVPRPVRVGKPSARFPKRWTIMTWVPGDPLDRTSVSRGDHAASTLADFLRALHAAAPAERPGVVDRGAHPGAYTEGFDHLLRSVALDGRGDGARAVWDDAVAAPAWEGPPVLVHGDLHPANVVVSDGTLSGVIDFGDLFAGDPAWDPAAAWVALPGAGPRGSSTRTRGRTGPRSGAPVDWPRSKSLFLMLMGHNGDRGLPGGKPAWGPAGQGGARSRPRHRRRG
ncbi:phosphotransferase [Streptomyces badius]